MDMLIGNRISELGRETEIEENTRFLVTRFDKVSKEIVESYGLAYPVLSSQIFEEVKKRIHVGTMAYQEKDDYSKITHTHDYSHVDAEVFYGPDSSRNGMSHKMVDLGTIEISNYNSLKSIHICVPYIKFQKPKDYRVGELKFIYISSDMIDSELDQRGYSPSYGWVIPDGSTYSRDEYPEAYELYGDGNSSTFRVPVVDGFFRLNPGINMADALQKR